MEIATGYAEQLVALDRVDGMIDTQARTISALDEIAGREDVEPFDRLQQAQALMRGRDIWDAARDIRRVTRLLDNASSIAAGWRGLYCPSARPGGAAGLEGQERCNAFAAVFVDRIRINNPSPVEIREREAREAERQTILKARITRSNRDDLLSLWRLRTETYDTLKKLERARVLQESAENVVRNVRELGCVNGESS